MQQAGFITFEGCEGCGKSTQADLLNKALVAANISSILTREPGGTESAELIRSLLLHSNANLYPITELLLVNASRYQHAKEKILPALRAKQFVICDRFVDSTMAYQGFAKKIGKKIPAILHNLLMEGLVPDLTFILDIDPSKSFKINNQNKDRFENLSLDFHNAVRNGYLEIASIAKQRCFLIDGHQDIKVIHQEITKTVSSFYKINLNLAI